MPIKEDFSKIEYELSRYRYLIGLIIIFLLITLIIATFKNFEKQNQIIETGGFIDGKIKCVCNEEAWNEYSNFQKNPLNVSIEKNLNG